MKKKSVFGFIKGLLKRKDSHEKQRSLLLAHPDPTRDLVQRNNSSLVF